jgi:hypothetical protein
LDRIAQQFHCTASQPLNQKCADVTAENELDWISPKRKNSPARPLEAIVRPQVVHAVQEERRAPPGDTIRNVKATVLRSREGRSIEENSVNPYAESLLRRKLNESLMTAAQKSIATFPSNAVGNSIKIPKTVPTEFDSVEQRKADTQARIPDFFKNKIERTTDNSYAAIAQRTKAAQTLNRPKPDFKSNEDNDQGSISVNQPSAKIPQIEPPLEDGKSMAASTLPQNRKGKAYNGDPQKFPEIPTGDGGSNI